MIVQVIWNPSIGRQRTRQSDLGNGAVVDIEELRIPRKTCTAKLDQWKYPMGDNEHAICA